MRDLGDFQTPPALVAAILDRLGPVGRRWTRVLEPSCGRGHFLAGLLALDPPPGEIHGVEIQPAYLEAARSVAADAPATVRVGLTGGSLFDVDLARAPGWRGGGPLLVVGNPPWVTNAELGALGSGNRPPRTNVKRARGIDAMTGASNFDIAEAVWFKLLDELGWESPTIALLCKTTVARNVLEHVARRRMPLSDAWVARIDARAWFGAAVEACLLCITLGPGTVGRVPVFDGLDRAATSVSMGLVRGRVVADLDAYAPFAFADGDSPLVWRQGLKHDAADVMELEAADGRSFRNKRGESVDVEPERLFPLLKGRDLSQPSPTPAHWVVLTQRKVGEDTAELATSAPRLWSYLNGHAGDFERRRSSIYRGRSAFAMFGVGPYCFAPFKVAVSALHRNPVFHAVGPEGGRPVMLDDTGYFLACRSPEQAGLAATLLNGPDAIGLLRSLALPGAKRAVTKAALQRVGLSTLLDRADRPSLLDRAGTVVERLAGRPADWPEPLEALLAPT